MSRIVGCVALLALAVCLLWPQSGATQERRVALVIGNADYAHAQALINPANDARAMAAALRRIGFAATTLQLNADRAAMSQALQAFTRDARGADVALVFFAGHGLELGGRNYLVPTDARIATDDDVPFEAVPLDLVLRAVDGARRLRLIVLDACRHNPFLTRMVMSGGASRSAGRGLAAIEPVGDMLVAYAAKDGQLAEDGRGANSPYTAALLQHIETPGLEIQFLFRKVRDSVLGATGNRQQPHVYGSLGGEPYYLVPPAPAPAAPAASSGDPRQALDLAFWRSIEASRDPVDFEAYLRQFPDGTFAELARNRIAALRPPAAAPAAAPPPPSSPRPPRPSAAPPHAEPARPPAAGALRPATCAAILQKVQLGEPLNDEERTIFASRCR